MGVFVQIHVETANERRFSKAIENDTMLTVVRAARKVISIKGWNIREEDEIESG